MTHDQSLMNAHFMCAFVNLAMTCYLYIIIRIENKDDHGKENRNNSRAPKKNNHVL